MGRIMIAGTSSGCGKTTIVCAILQALVNRGKRVVGWKCGPDYIDPMFYSRITGERSYNLDGFFMDTGTLNRLLAKNGSGSDISVIEGVMGYYDGVGMEDTASSHAVARDTNTPVVLVVSCRGMGRSVQALLDGYLDFMGEPGICGVIFNQLPAGMYPAMETYCRKRGLKALGCFPRVPDAEFPSRHLGLVMADEIVHWREKIRVLAGQAEEYLDLDGLLELAGQAAEPVGGKLAIPGENGRVRIGVARDSAFCFYYEDNLSLLRELGCELVEFSPMQDEGLPADLDGLILGGGYPELYGRELEQNEPMRREIRKSIVEGLPTHAECGGYLYLHRNLTDADGQTWQMAGVLAGEAVFTRRLQHFGYVTLTAQEDTLLCRKGDTIRAHEFHRCRSTLAQDAFRTEKNGKSWGSFISCYRLLAGFPHIHYYANTDFAVNFYRCCRDYRLEKEASGQKNPRKG